MSDQAALPAIRERVQAICLAFPEAEGSNPAGQHLNFKVRGKTFTYFLVDHHGDGRIALNCKAAPGAQDVLVRAHPARFFIPAYLGARGWIGIDLEVPGLDCDEVAAHIAESYALIAPKRLVAQMATS